MNKRDRKLEKLIALRNETVMLLQAISDMCSDMVERGMWRDESRRAAADVARLVALRSPEKVARMEAERGLT